MYCQHIRWKELEDEKYTEEERYKKSSIGGGEWRFLSRQKQDMAKLNKRMSCFCAERRNLPSRKNAGSENISIAYRRQDALLRQLEQAFLNGFRGKRGENSADNRKP